ncbi:cytochrome P450 [Mycena amicta]|nr:cytochrome P450 [Mycena amicta]
MDAQALVGQLRSIFDSILANLPNSLLPNSIADVVHAHPILIRLILAGLAARFIHTRYLSSTGSMRYMPGPKNDSWLRGNKDRMDVSRNREWQSIYGPTFKTYNMFNSATLFTTNTTALHHIVNRSDIYQKAPMVRWGLAQLLGRGLLVMEDEEHTRLRKIMSPAFSASQVRLLTPLFLDKSLELVSVWSALPNDEAGCAKTDVLKGLKAMTLDVIGLAGFNYEFNALSPTKNDGINALGIAFRKLFQMQRNRQRTPVAFLRARFPWFRAIFPSPKKVSEARQAMESVGMQLLQDAKNAYEGDREGVEKGISGGPPRRDLLSLLVQSNLSEDEHQRLSDEVVVAQIPTFFVAGHETTSTATAWALFALAAHPVVQSTLRAELLTMGTDSPSLDALNSLPYLDMVVREVMRLYAPVALTNRVAMKDDVIPLGKDGAYTDLKGVLQESVTVKKGQMIHVPIGALNRDKSIWGADVEEFKPERWAAGSLPSATSSIPGVYSHLFTFLGGPHNCIGWRFSLAEMKSLIYTLTRAFEFTLPEGLTKDDIVRASAVAVQRPTLRSRPEEGNQLPMRLRRIQM